MPLRTLGVTTAPSPRGMVRGLLPVIVGLGVAMAFAPVAVDAMVPVADSTDAVITVRIGGDRVSGAITDTGSAASAFTGVAGARLGLFAMPTDPDPIAQSWAVCVSDDDGDCSFKVPDTVVGGANRDARFTVKQLSAPAGWSANASLRTDTDAGYQATPYRFRTGPELRAGVTYSSLHDFMYTSADSANFENASASSGVWQQSRTNPQMSGRCGLDVALVFDTSSSVGSAMPRLIDAADSLVDALTGTRSRAAAFSFSALSPGVAAGPNHPELTSVSTPDGASAFKEKYASWAISTGTNWDRGLFVPAAAAEHYDVAVIITDGNPTSYGDPRPATRSVGATRFKELEYGIASANALKAEGTRVIAVGVGSGIGLTPISGPIAYDGSNAAQADSFSLSDFPAAGAALHDLAAELCEGSLSVVTQLVPADNEGEDVSGAVPVGAGWEISGETDSAGVSGLPATLTTTDDGTGTVSFPLGFAVATQAAVVRVTRTAPFGYHLVTQSGENAACHELSGQAPVAVTNVDNGFQVEARPEAAVSCTLFVAPDDEPVPGNFIFGTLDLDPLTVDGRIVEVRDADGNGQVSAGDAVYYEYGVTNTGSLALHNLRVVSPLVGAVVCPVVDLQPKASTICVGHAPYVLTTADETAGAVDVGVRAVGQLTRGTELSSADGEVVTELGVPILAALPARAVEVVARLARWSLW